MSGNKIGGVKAAQANKSKYGDDYYIKMGKLGGSVKVPKGFALMDKEKVRLAGVKGGSTPRRVNKIGKTL